ncbi:helix-turn-helix domain-containing protein [Escherichia coli]|uniref:helix-turn-helix domain-containing protein n=1 Tax=Escherichia coli TaxID=562 RepID=UPI001A92F37D|nr:helix-turn-helix domain-containing protein [Escherichia coli]MBO0256071.1 helix-turn-helix domain-containing protein [Escherichia coli]
MKSIHDIRRDNLKDLIDREFNGVQSRLAERMEIEPNLVSRWSNNKKKIGDTVARKIEKAGNKPTNWLDVDHYFAMQDDVAKMDAGQIGEVAAHNLKAWMGSNRELSSQQKLAEASGISQASINRMLRNEVSITIANLDAIAAAFGRRGYELLIPPNDPATINYDRSRYALLPEAEKENIKNFIDFVMVKNDKQQP